MLSLQNNPFPQIKTDRLLLRQLRDEDSELLFEFRSDPKVMQYVGRPCPKKIEEITELIALINRGIEQNETLFWGIELRSSSSSLDNDLADPLKPGFCGSIGFWRVNPEARRAEIGYLLGAKYWGQRIMSEALWAVVNYGFTSLRLSGIHAEIDPRNDASARLLQRLRFKRDADDGEIFFPRDDETNGHFYTLLASQWKLAGKGAPS